MITTGGESMINVLWISLRVPYDTVRHASGKIHNYYLKELIKEPNVNLKLITFCKKDEYEIAVNDHKTNNIDSDIYYWDVPLIAKAERALVRINPLDKYGGGTISYYWKKIEKSLKKLANIPNVIILDWTEMLLFLPKIKAIFPDAKYVSIEEDVLLLNFQRQYESCKKGIKKQILRLKYRKLKQLELSMLKGCDLVILNNPKDQQLVTREGVKNTWYWSPYFQNLSSIQSGIKKNKNILYYGSMSRPENHFSVLHLINDIFPQIDDKEAKLIIVGNSPRESLLQLQSERIIITGFVEDISPYFESSLCLCAPLILGAGVKIKIIEALSAGLTVLTNDIGIEGIPAKNGTDYIYCETDQDFIESLNDLLKDKIDTDQIGHNAKQFINKQYDIQKDAQTFIAYINSLADN